jgi:hypothetical protein
MQRYERTACGPHCGRVRLRPRPSRTTEVGAVFLAHHAPLPEPGGLFFAQRVRVTPRRASPGRTHFYKKSGQRVSRQPSPAHQPVSINARDLSARQSCLSVLWKVGPVAGGAAGPVHDNSLHNAAGGVAAEKIVSDRKPTTVSAFAPCCDDGSHLHSLPRTP